MSYAEVCKCETVSNIFYYFNNVKPGSTLVKFYFSIVTIYNIFTTVSWHILQLQDMQKSNSRALIELFDYPCDFVGPGESDP